LQSSPHEFFKGLHDEQPDQNLELSKTSAPSIIAYRDNNSTQVVFKSGKTNFRTFKIQWKTMTQNYGNEEYIEIIRQIKE